MLFRIIGDNLMDLSNIYNKLPKRLKKSENLTIILMKIYKFITKHKKNNEEENQMLNFLFKYTDIKVTGTLRDIQLIYVELMKFIDNVCNKYDLEYWLAYGTLIGAVRHEGFIPWDDDFDIIMMRTDYDKLIEVLPEEISKYPYFKEHCALTRLISMDENYFKGFNSIYDEGHGDYFLDSGLSKSLFLQLGWLKPLVKLDIFPYDYVKEESMEYYTKNYLAHKYYFRGLYSEENFSFDDEFKKRFEKLGFSHDETNYIAEGIDSSYFDDFGILDKNLIFPLKTINFEGCEFKCPNKCDEVLKIWYGVNYMNIPSDIRVHNYSEYNLSLFDSKQEMENSFKETLNYLIEINENFNKYE